MKGSCIDPAQKNRSQRLLILCTHRCVPVQNDDVLTGMKTFGDGGGVDVIASTETTADEVV